MYTHVEKSKENSDETVINHVSQKKINGKQGFGLTDNRPEAIAQRKLREMTGNSPLVSQQKAFLQMANNSPQVKQVTQLQGMADNYAAGQQNIHKKENLIGIKTSCIAIA